MTSVRRELTLKPLKPVLERASGMRIFEGDEIVAALERARLHGDPPAALGPGPVRRRPAASLASAGRQR